MGDGRYGPMRSMHWNPLWPNREQGCCFLSKQWRSYMYRNMESSVHSGLPFAFLCYMKPVVIGYVHPISDGVFNTISTMQTTEHNWGQNEQQKISCKFFNFLGRLASLVQACTFVNLGILHCMFIADKILLINYAVYVTLSVWSKKLLYLI